MINYEEITNQILNNLSQNKTWIKPWKEGRAGFSFFGNRNLISNKPYRGINALITASSGFSSQYWLTEKQTVKLGGSVNGIPTTVIFYSFYNNGDKKSAFIGAHNIYNVDQCIGIDHKRLHEVRKEEKGFDDNLTAEELIKNYKEMPVIQYGKGTGSYSPTLDVIMILEKAGYKSEDHFYSTLFHEIVHSTGHKKRLNRKGIVNYDKFGSEQYSEEELIAELGNAFLSAYCGINQIENSSAYINSWAKVLKSDPKMIIKAANAAQKAVDYIIKRSVNIEIKKVVLKKVNITTKKKSFRKLIFSLDF